ncbi:MAG TPA: hypothetical protein VL337_11755 [Acidimicrobiales bacterium]|nr:hypothetical protein [Acidimicrobiales bacterium]
MSLPRPSPRRLGVAVVAIGLLAAVSALVLPVEASVGGDPLLRLRAFGAGPAQLADEVRCGTPLASLSRRSDGLSLYVLAADRACRHASSRRAAAAVAAAAVIGLLGVIGLTGAGRKEAVA